MFSMLWRFFPGPAWLRIIVMLAVFAGIVYALVFYGYPWVAQFVDSEEISTVGSWVADALAASSAGAAKG